MSTSWGSLLSLAAEQHQVIAVRQVAPLGIDPATFRRRARRDDWIEHGGTLWSPPGNRLDEWGLRAGWTCLRLGWWEFDHGWNGFLAELRDTLTGSRREASGRGHG